MKYLTVNIAKQYKAIALSRANALELLNLPTDIIILLGINIILSLIIIIG